jgi:sodium pump decarboxylase gamma subunit
MNDFYSGLIITAIGMGLVFVAIVFLWGMMALMVRLDRNTSSEIIEQEEKPSDDKSVSTISKKQQAAVAALAVALAQGETKQLSPSNMNIEQISTWQSVQRAQVLQEKSRIFAHRQTRRS